MKMISTITDSIFEKLNDEELLLINELYSEMKKKDNIINELEKHLITMSKIYEEEYKDIDTSEDYKSILAKLKELKENNNGIMD